MPQHAPARVEVPVYSHPLPTSGAGVDHAVSFADRPGVRYRRGLILAPEGSHVARMGNLGALCLYVPADGDTVALTAAEAAAAAKAGEYGLEWRGFRYV